jgi:hypothetical protein
MCSKPKAPKIPDPPPPVQEAKQPDSAVARDSAKRNRQGIVGGSLLTSPSGATGARTGGSTLLGM